MAASRVHRVSLKRGTLLVQIEVRSEPFSSVLAASLEHVPWRNASMLNLEMSDMPEQAYVSGLRAVVSGSDLVIAKVVPGTPAERAGLRMGDRITCASPLDALNVASTLEGAYFRPHLNLTVKRGRFSMQASLTMMSMTELLGSAVQSPAVRALTSQTE